MRALGLLIGLFAAFPVFAVSLNSVTYADLKDWPKQNYAGALESFRISCDKSIDMHASLKTYTSEQKLRHACDLAAKQTPASARKFFETNFQPYRISSEDKGFVTAYYIPLLEASLKQEGEYQWPVYGLPDDFKTPYLTRKQIAAGALEGKGYEIAWMKDPVMRFFLHVQGSGNIKLPDGRMMTLQFAAKNEQPYTAIGKVLIEEGHLTKQNVSLQSIRDYLYANPQRVREILNHNDSYVFFSLNEKGDVPKGAQGVSLTGMHSLAIDREYWSFGLPFYLNVDSHNVTSALVVSQDTGSAIKGSRRGDIFIGYGPEAERIAGTLAAPAEWAVLLPK